MKSFFLNLIGAAALLSAATGCNSKDSVDNAKDVNEAKVESASATTDLGSAEKKGMEYDAEFMAKAASGGLLEVKMGQEVIKRAVTPQAKEFAQKMVSDHQKSNAELKALAAQKNITVPATMADEQNNVYKDVLEKKGVKMDQEYMKEMIKDHQEDVKEYTEASTKAADPEIKAFATKNVPVLQMHLAMVTKMEPAVDAHK